MNHNSGNIVSSCQNKAEKEANTWKIRYDNLMGEQSSFEAHIKTLQSEQFLYKCFVAEMGLNSDMQRFQDDRWPEDWEGLWNGRYKGLQKSSPMSQYKKLNENYQTLFSICTDMISYGGRGFMVRLLNTLTIAYMNQEKDQRDMSNGDECSDFIDRSCHSLMLGSFILHLEEQVDQLCHGTNEIKK